MAKDGVALQRWLDEASIPQTKRTPDRMAVFKAAYAFLQQTGRDYASRRMLAHFLLNSGLDLKLAQIARLVGVTRPTASRQNRLSSREVIREIQQQMEVDVERRRERSTAGKPGISRGVLDAVDIPPS